jgi:hypothetical protein
VYNSFYTSCKVAGLPCRSVEDFGASSERVDVVIKLTIVKSLASRVYLGMYAGSFWSRIFDHTQRYTIECQEILRRYLVSFLSNVDANMWTEVLRYTRIRQLASGFNTRRIPATMYSKGVPRDSQELVSRFYGTHGMSPVMS